MVSLSAIHIEICFLVVKPSLRISLQEVLILKLVPKVAYLEAAPSSSFQVFSVMVPVAAETVSLKKCPSRHCLNRGGNETNSAFHCAIYLFITVPPHKAKVTCKTSQKDWCFQKDCKVEGEFSKRKLWTKYISPLV